MRVCAPLLSHVYLRPHGLEPTRLLCPRDSSGKHTELGCHALLQRNLFNPGIEPVSPAPPALQVDSLPWGHCRSPRGIPCHAEKQRNRAPLKVRESPKASQKQSQGRGVGLLIYPWRETYPTSTYSSAILFSHSSVLAWKISWTEEPGKLQSMGLQKSERDLAAKQQQTTKFKA